MASAGFMSGGSSAQRAPSSNGWPLRLTVVLIAALVTGCARSPSEPPQPPQAPAVGPRETLRLVMELRSERKYAELRSLIVPQREQEVITTLMAVDAFLDANRRLCVWIRDNVGVGLAQTIDQAYMGDTLGIFARHVELLDESITGNQAGVSFTIDGRLPADQARLRLVYDVWRYDPEGGYSEHLPAAFREMARGLERVLAELEAGRMPTADLRGDPDRLVERVQSHLRPGVKLLSKARIEAEAGDGE